MIADCQHVRICGNFPNSLQDAVILPHLRTAETRLTRWVGPATYEAAEALAAELDEPRDFTDTELDPAVVALADAEAFLAISVGLKAFNTVMESVSGGDAAGISTEGTVGESTFRYLKPGEIKALQSDYLAQAEQAAIDYLLDAHGGGVPGPGISYALDHDGYAIDDDWPRS